MQLICDMFVKMFRRSGYMYLFFFIASLSKCDLQIKFSMSCVKKRFLIFVFGINGFISRHEGLLPRLLIEPSAPFSGASMNEHIATR